MGKWETMEDGGGHKERWKSGEDELLSDGDPGQWTAFCDDDREKSHSILRRDLTALGNTSASIPPHYI